MKKKILLVSILFSMLVLMSSFVSAIYETSKFQSSDIVTNDNFGSAVAMTPDGNIAIVGADRVENPASSYQDGGAAYILTWNGASWTEQQKIYGSLGDTPQYNNAIFGASADISNDGNTAIIGAYHYRDSSHYHTGAAYIFVNNGIIKQFVKILYQRTPFHQTECC